MQQDKPTRNLRVAIALAVAVSVALGTVVWRLRTADPQSEMEVVAGDRTRGHPTPRLATTESLPSQSRDLRTPSRERTAPASTTARGAFVVRDQLILTYRPGTSASTRRAVRASLNVDLVTDLRPLPADLVATRGRSIRSVRKAAAALDAVAYAEPNFIYRATETRPDDPGFRNLWGLDNTGQSILGSAGVVDADIDAIEAWDTTRGSRTVAVGVVDTGIDYSHVDLASNMWTNPGESGDGRETNGIDDDNNGYIDDWRGWDWVDGDNDPADLQGHGTHVAGTIGARGNDGVGITGVNWRIGLVPLRSLGADGSGTTAGIAAAFAYAGRLGIPVVNASLGGPGFSQTLSDTIARYPNTLYVVAAGNDGKDNEATPQYPCNYTASNLLCVASTTNADRLSSFSNYGAVSVDLAAPGSSILSAVPNFVDVFRDPFDTELAGRWTTTGGWGRGQDSSGAFLSDSPGSGYVGPSDTQVTTEASTNLSSVRGCRLRYDLRLGLGTNQDLLRVEASRDGQTWQSVARWSGSTSGRWISMNDDLSNFDGTAAVYLRFRLIASAGSQGAGADIDNVRIQCLAGEPSSNYSYYSGTSMASPHVAGAAGLLWGALASPSVPQVRDALVTGADPTPALAGKVVSGARMNVARSLKLLGPLVEQPQTPPSSPAPTAARPTPSPSGTTPGPSPTSGGTTPTSTPSPSPSDATPIATPSLTPGVIKHDRSVSLRLEGNLIAKGRITGAAVGACENGVPIKVLRNGTVVGRGLTTGDGSYRIRLRSRRGRYLTVAPRVVLVQGLEECAQTTSDDGGVVFRRNVSESLVSGSSCARYTGSELEFVTTMNAARTRAGSSELVIDRKVSDVARRHNEEMAAVTTVFHIAPAALLDALSTSEELAQIVASGTSSQNLLDALMGSSPHTETIRRQTYTHVGIDIVQHDGRTWLTVLFADGPAATAGEALRSCE